MYVFLIPLLLGFALSWASAFTAAFSRRWGERGGQLVSLLLRNVVGIPLWVVGFALAYQTPSAMLIQPSPITEILGWLLVAVGCIEILSALPMIGWRSVMPSVRDTLAIQGIYAHVRHPIYSGALLEFVGLALLKPTPTGVLACAVGIGGIIVQARLEELDLLQRLPAYHEYMNQVPRFLPRFRKKRTTSSG